MSGQYLVRQSEVQTTVSDFGVHVSPKNGALGNNCITDTNPDNAAYQNTLSSNGCTLILILQG
jgi:hypothetical protein